MNVERIYKELNEDVSFFFAQTGLSQAYHEKYLTMLCHDIQFQELQKVVLSGDYENGHMIAHTLKGAALSLGLNRLGNAASQLCSCLRTKLTDQIQPLLGEVICAYQLVLEAVAEGETAKEVATAPEHKQITILLVDDHEANRSLLADILGNEYKILEAEDGAEALALLRKHKSEISLMLLDLVMPGMTGFQVLSAKQEEKALQDIPVILISADDSPTSMDEGYRLGASDYISRPFHAQVVQRRIKTMLMLHEKQQELVDKVQHQLENKEQLYIQVMEMLCHLIEFPQGESRSHLQNIRQMTEIFLRELSQIPTQTTFTPGMITDIAQSSIFHDLGMIGVSQATLQKKGKLTQIEWEQIQQHPQKGVKLLEELRKNNPDTPLLLYGEQICRWHHHQWDGKGYPSCTEADHVPEYVHAVRLADVYDSLVSPRPYRKAYAHKDAVAMILSGQCGSFPPELIGVFSQKADALPQMLNKTIEKRENTAVNTVIRDLSGQNVGDISPRTVSLLEIERVKNQYLAELSNEILFEYDDESQTLKFSERATTELGVPMEYSRYKVATSGDFKGFSPEDKRRIDKAMQQLTDENSRIQLELVITTPLGHPVWYEMTARGIWSKPPQRKRLYIVGKLTNIQSRKEQTKKLQQLATQDSLTGLFNRGAAEYMVNSYLAGNTGKHGGFLLMDIDAFKHINDTWGHPQGDKVLQQLAENMLSRVRKDDVVARLGGDEFMIFLKDCASVSQILQKAQLLLKDLSSQVEGEPCTLSMGVATAPEDGTNFAELMKKADIALYCVKKTRKNNVMPYHPSMNGKKGYTLGLSGIEAKSPEA